jgi:3-methyladenine DNA glycosylase AlkC
MLINAEFFRFSVMPMKIVDSYTETLVKQNVVNPISRGAFDIAITSLPPILNRLYEQIPGNRRVSFGRVYTIRVLSDYLYKQFCNQNVPLYQSATQLYELSVENHCKGVALGILSQHGLSNYQIVLPHFAKAAGSSEWEIREFAQMFFRKLVSKYPNELRAFLLTSVRSKDANVRRFAAETLRPVQENQWIYTNPEYSLSILGYLFTEKEAYPRTAVGNNLSDLARRLPNLVYDLVKKLVQSGDKNSYWIAYRACRNLVKKEPLKVLNLLGTDVYQYKKRIYRRRDLLQPD